MKKIFTSLKHKLQALSLSKTIMAVSAAVVVTLALVGGLLAKYLTEKNYKDNLVTAENFYFTVDLLGATVDAASSNREIHLYGGAAQSLPLHVCNFFDDERVASGAISYTFKLEEDSAKEVTLTQGSTPLAAGEEHAFTMAAGGTKQEIPFLIDVAKGYANGTRLTVTVKSTAPYTKTMTVTFILHSYSYDLLFRVEDKGSYIDLVLMANVDIPAEKIKIDWSDINATGNILEVDSTNNYLNDPLEDEDDLIQATINPVPADPGYYKSFWVTSAMKPTESISVYFFKSDISHLYDTDMLDIGVEKNDDGTYTVTIKKKGEYQA